MSKKQLDNESVKGLIELKNVCFTYPTRPDQQVLKNLSCRFEPGKTTAIVGPSGSGKSTVIQLIERFYDPDSGQVLLDGMDIIQINLKSLRTTLGYVGQEPVLFNTSIRENLKFGKANATDEEIIAALESANAYDFISAKMGEGGIDTVVGAAGGQLSGGQKQRIAIARAFIKKPKILLLDEATSALDKKNERMVQEAIDRIRKSLGAVTTIVIAHRLSTIKDSDNILVMKHGELKEQGNHERLLQEYPDGIYAQFVQQQEAAEKKAAEEEKNAMDEEELPNELKNSLAESRNYMTARSKSRRGSTFIQREEVEMWEKANLRDEHIEKMDKAAAAKAGSRSLFRRVFAYNSPTWMFWVGIFCSLGVGFIQPVFGIFFSKILAVLSVTEEYVIEVLH